MIRLTDDEDKPGLVPDRFGSTPAADCSGRPLDLSAIESGGYGRVFWLCYLANTSFMTALSVLFRYADFVTLLGGTEMHLGLIVGVGMVGALMMRGFQGIAIDRYGSHHIWLASLALFSVTMLAHLTITQLNGPAVYLLRIVMMIAVAGAFGSCFTYISLRAPVARIPEMIGVLSSSGFVGLAIGPILGDWLFDVPEISLVQVRTMFVLAAALTGISLVCAALATRGQARHVRRRQPPIIPLVRRYHPGAILFVAIAVGMVAGVPHTFLRPYAAELGISGIKTFFLVYAASAFTIRIAGRNLSQRIGTRSVILLGLGCLSISMLLYLVVWNEWMLVLPALVAGLGHGLMFPCIVGSSSSTFPLRYRGLAMMLMLVMLDTGSMIGQPAMGGILELCNRWGLPSYPIMFITAASIAATTAVIYAFVTRRTSKFPVEGMNVRRRQKSQAVVKSEQSLEVQG